MYEVNCHLVLVQSINLLPTKMLVFFVVDVVIFIHFVCLFSLPSSYHVLGFFHTIDCTNFKRSLTHWFALKYFTIVAIAPPDHKFSFVPICTAFILSEAHTHLPEQCLFCARAKNKFVAFSNTIMWNRTTYIKLAWHCIDRMVMTRVFLSVLL